MDGHVLPEQHKKALTPPLLSSRGQLSPHNPQMLGWMKASPRCIQNLPEGGQVAFLGWQMDLSLNPFQLHAWQVLPSSCPQPLIPRRAPEQFWASWIDGLASQETSFLWMVWMNPSPQGLASNLFLFLMIALLLAASISTQGQMVKSDMAK